MSKYQFTNQRDMRTAFWQFCQESGQDYKGKKTKFNIDMNLLFKEFKDCLLRDGVISKNLYDKAHLYT